MPEDNKELQTVKEDEHEEMLSDELSEVLEDMPPEVRKHVEKFMISSVQMGGIMRPENAISKKITEKHITEFLDGSRQQMKEEYKERHESKIFKCVILIIMLIFIIAVIVLLKETPQIMEMVLYTLAGVFGGALGGYGYGKTRRDDE